MRPAWNHSQAERDQQKVEPELYLNVRDHRRGLGLDVLPLPGPDDIRIDALIRRLLSLEPRQVFCEQYYEPTT